jgi:hypothetical protein
MLCICELKRHGILPLRAAEDSRVGCGGNVDSHNHGVGNIDSFFGILLRISSSHGDSPLFL